MKAASNAAERGWIEELLRRNEDLSRQVEELDARLQAALAKLGVDRRTRAAERAVEIGLLPPPTPVPEEKDAKRLGNISRFGVPLSNGWR